MNNEVEMKRDIIPLALVILIALFIKLTAQSSSLYMPRNIQKAYENQTRDWDGKPGSRYWQNRADYSIDINFNPNTLEVRGKETITYFNNSPHTLDKLVFHLFPNLYKEGSMRDFDLDPEDASDGVTIEEITIEGDRIDTSSNSNSLRYNHTLMYLTLQNPLPPASSLSIDISWYYTLNKTSHMRTGAVDSSSFFIAYFFPRIAVYDDIDDWNESKYTGIAEFYNDFGDFDVSITVPENFIVWATGLLQNPEEVLTKKYLKRYKATFQSDEIIQIINQKEAEQKNISKSNPKNTWKFKATNVNDYAFALSDHYLWDASSLVVDRKTGRRVLIDAAYNRNSKDFYQVAKIARQSIEYMSKKLPGIPFPYPQETVFNGADEMEYPMMVNDMSKANIDATFKLTSHEIFHTYFPFYMGINETKYAWMDEGWASFADYEIVSELVGPEKAIIYYLSAYKRNAGQFSDVPMISDSKYLKRPIYHYNSYAKPAVFLIILRDQLGEENFKEALHEYINRWNGKHPTPYDFFFSFTDVYGSDLDWLIKPWYFEDGYVDLAIGDISQKGTNQNIEIQNKGKFPAPFALKIEYENGGTETIKQKASVWKNGNKKFLIEIANSKTIKKIELVDLSLVDANLSNNKLKVE